MAENRKVNEMPCEWIHHRCSNRAVVKIGQRGLWLCAQHEAEYRRHLAALRWQT